MVRKRLKTAADIVEMLGGQTALAKDLNALDGVVVEVTRRTCQNWVSRDRFPVDWIYPIYLVAKRRNIDVTLTMLAQHGAQNVMTAKSILKEGAS